MGFHWGHIISYSRPFTVKSLQVFADLISPRIEDLEKSSAIVPATLEAQPWVHLFEVFMLKILIHNFFTHIRAHGLKLVFSLVYLV